jgi:hypothetical protein
MGVLLNQPQEIIARPPFTVDRNNPQHSLNFSIPAAFTGAGRLILTARAYAVNQSGTGPGWLTGQLTLADFAERPAIQQLQAVLIADGLRNIPAPTFSTWVSDLFTEVVPRLPFAVPRLQLNAPLHHISGRDLDSWLGGQLAVLDLALMILLSTGAVGGPRCGVLPPSAARPFGGIGAAKTLVSAPALIYSAGDGAAFAHELGHTFGFGHSRRCGAPDPIDPRLPATGLTDATGWNTVTNTIVPSGSPDLMSWCRGGEWPSLNFYTTLLNAPPI